jgi:uncharacterized protein (DUF1697 family)
MRYVAFLRGINVGGNTMIPMKELADLFIKAGLTNVRTYINSGNVIFESELSEVELKATLEKALLEKIGKDIPVVIRNTGELRSIASRNPFPEADPSKVGVVLLTNPVAKSFMDGFAHPGPENIVPAGREIYIFYPNGMGRSKLKLPVTLEAGTIRNINTIAKLADLIED